MAWIKVIPPDEAKGELKQAYEAAQAHAGGFIDLVALQSLNPLVLRSVLDLYEKIMHGQSSLSSIEREMIAVVVCRILGATYLMEAHAETLRGLTQDERSVRLLKIDYRMLLLEERVRAMLDFAAKVTLNFESVDTEVLQDLRTKGLSDEDILNVTEVVGLFNYLSRLGNVLGVQATRRDELPVPVFSGTRGSKSE